jgi:PAS domain S-box-containing protein
MVIFFVRYHNKLNDKVKRQQAKILAIAFTIPIILALITDSLFPLAKIDFPGLGAISGSITTFFVAYGMLKYQLFSFRPEIAAESIFARMSDAVILVMLDGKIMKVNQAFIDLSEYTEQEVVGKSINELLHISNTQNQDNSKPIIENLRYIREIKNRELTFLTKTGQKRVGTVSGSIVCDSGGKDVGIAFILHDVTERRIIEQKLLKAERFASIGELAGMLGHDLRNPLAGIRNANFYLRRKLDSEIGPQEKAMFESIDKNIDYSNKIVNDLLDYASFYSDDIKLELSLVTPKALVKAALSLSVQPQNVEIIDKTQDTPQFNVDEVKICRSFINIFKNAFDAMPNGGELQVLSESKDKMITFTFRDNGCGMTKETIEKLWTPLFTTKAKGMGFGMVICKRNVKAHGGKITLESVLGEGTTITVELPLNLKP